ncbi:hypothetical protein HDU93_000561 [Gonapodya sp. JEL0774]|nr:hypothetical protein HDU93_000561 [Gonapodya sp. JEL0774]
MLAPPLRRRSVAEGLLTPARDGGRAMLDNTPEDGCVADRAIQGGIRRRPLSQVLTDSVGALVASLVAGTGVGIDKASQTGVSDSHSANQHSLTTTRSATFTTQDEAESLSNQFVSAPDQLVVSRRTHVSAFAALRARECAGPGLQASSTRTRASFLSASVRLDDQTTVGTHTLAAAERSPSRAPPPPFMTTTTGSSASSLVLDMVASAVYTMLGPSSSQPSQQTTASLNSSAPDLNSLNTSYSLLPDSAPPLVRLAARKLVHSLHSPFDPFYESSRQTFDSPTIRSTSIANDLDDDWESDAQSTNREMALCRRPTELDFSGLDKAFAACWLSEDTLLVGTKCSSLALFSLPSSHHHCRSTTRRVILPSLAATPSHSPPDNPFHTHRVIPIAHPTPVRPCPVPPLLTRPSIRYGRAQSMGGGASNVAVSGSVSSSGILSPAGTPPVIRRDSGFSESNDGGNPHGNRGENSEADQDDLDNQHFSLEPSGIAVEVTTSLSGIFPPQGAIPFTTLSIDNTTPTLRPVVPAPCPGIHHLLPNPSHTLLVVSAAPPFPLVVYSLERLEPIVVLRGNDDAVFSSTWVGDYVVVSAGRDGSVGVWNVAIALEGLEWGGEWVETAVGPLKALDPVQFHRAAHGGLKVRGVSSVAAGASEVVTVGGDGSVRVWSMGGEGGLKGTSIIRLHGEEVEPVPLLPHSPRLHLLGTQRRLHLLDTRLCHPAFALPGPDSSWGVRSAAVPYIGAGVVAVGGGAGGVGVADLGARKYLLVGGGRRDAAYLPAADGVGGVVAGLEGARFLSTPVPSFGRGGRELGSGGTGIAGVPHAAMCIAWGGGGLGQSGVGRFAVGGGPLQVCAEGGWGGVW